MHWSTKLLIVGSLMFSCTMFCNQAKAFEVREHPEFFVDFNVTSSHDQPYWYDDEGQQHEFNEDNAGVGLRYEFHDNWDVGVGFYDNSFGKTSVYAGVEAHTKRSRWVSVGVAAGFVSGYIGTPTNNIFIVLPVVQLGPPQMGIRVGYLPFGEVKYGTMQFYLGF